MDPIETLKGIGRQIKKKEYLLEGGSPCGRLSTGLGSNQVTQTWKTVCTVLGNMQMVCRRDLLFD